MEKKHTGKIIGLMVLMFVSSYGSNIETFLQANIDYNQAGIYALGYSLFVIGISSLIAMLIPFMCRLVKGKKLSHQRGNFLCVANSFIAVVISAILQEKCGILFVDGLYALIYFFINNWLFVEKDGQGINTQHANQPQVSNTSTTSHKEKIRYCSLCGSQIDNNSKKCTGCGKQYFKGFSYVISFLIILIILLTGTLLFIISNWQSLYPTKNSTFRSVANTHTSALPPPTEPYYMRLGLSLDEYKIASIVSYDVNKYCEYMADLKDLVENRTYSDELKRELVIDSINNNNNFEYGEKIILYRLLFPVDNAYNNDIVDYLNSRDDVSYEEMEFVLTELGFAVFADGTVTWD